MASFKLTAIIVAGGKGQRMQSPIKKQYIELAGIPVLTRTLMAFDDYPGLDHIILVIPEEDIEFCRKNIISPFSFKLNIHLAPGGVSRQDSVCNGLARAAELHFPHEDGIVLIHDGVRPFISWQIMDDCIKKADKSGACIPVLPISDTVKKISGRIAEHPRVLATLDRNRLFLAQTPQVFRIDLLLKAFAHARTSGFAGTDEASIVEHSGMAVQAVMGSKRNIKLTTRQDMDYALFLLGQARE